MSKNWNVGWGFTKLCNLNCSHCYNSSGKRDSLELTVEEAKRVVDTLKENNVKSINYGTGECGLLPDFWELVEYVHEKGIMQGLTTNGSSVNDKTIATIKKCLNDVDVSLDYAVEEAHNKFRGNHLAWRWAINGLRLLQEHDIERSITTCITSQNCDTGNLTGLLDIAREYGAHFRINWFKPTGRGKENQYLKLSIDQVNDTFRWLMNNTKVIALPDPYFSSLLGIKNGTDGCPCGQVSFRITPTGVVVPCVYFTKEFDNLNLRQDGFQEVVNSGLFQRIRGRNIPECRDCSVSETCRGGCASRAYLEHGSLDKPDAFCYKTHGITENPFSDLKIEFTPGKSMVHDNYLCTIIMEPK